ncbi:MAG: DUF58 domain-containing protein, partial [Desulfobulbaceae bacterium]|nr:DUF58 domain-containing protein [Desulfobulbaceae bacterium]
CIEMFIPPKKGVSHVLRLIRELLYFSPRKTRTDINGALDYMGRVIRKRGVVFLVSDFLAADFAKSMRVLARRHDMIAVSVTDPRETSLPNVGLIELEDAETGESILVDTGNARIRELYANLGQERSARLTQLFGRMSVDYIGLHTDQDYVRDLVRFFKTREQRRRH